MSDLWRAIETGTLADEGALAARLIASADLSTDDRARIAASGADLVRQIRADVRPGLMEVFLAEYGLSTEEGISLMCLAEALLRVPDAETMDALIEDKIAPSDWGKHLGHSASSLVNASTWALMLTGKVLEEDREPGIVGHLRGAMRRLGEPVIRRAVRQAMKEMGRQFVLGETINAAMERAAKMEEQGYTYSYDMLGEAAKTAEDAERYATAYSRAIAAISAAATPRTAASWPTSRCWKKRVTCSSARLRSSRKSTSGTPDLMLMPRNTSSAESASEPSAAGSATRAAASSSAKVTALPGSAR